MILEIDTTAKTNYITRQSKTFQVKVPRIDATFWKSHVSCSQWLLCTARHQKLQSLWNLTKHLKQLSILLILSKTRMSGDFDLLLQADWKDKDLVTADSVFQTSDCFHPDNWVRWELVQLNLVSNENEHWVSLKHIQQRRWDQMLFFPSWQVELAFCWYEQKCKHYPQYFTNAR